MMLNVILATLAGVLIGLSRQVNGRLALSSTPLVASLWNHAVGLVVLTLAGFAIGGVTVAALVPPEAAEAPLLAWIGGPLGVVFVAAGSWLIARIGAVNTALLVIGGQMVSGVALDLARDAPGSILARAAGVALILAGAAVTRLPHRAAAASGQSAA